MALFLKPIISVHGKLTFDFVSFEILFDNSPTWFQTFNATRRLITSSGFW